MMHVTSTSPVAATAATSRGEGVLLIRRQGAAARARPTARPEGPQAQQGEALIVEAITRGTCSLSADAVLLDGRGCQ